MQDPAHLLSLQVFAPSGRTTSGDVISALSIVVRFSPPVVPTVPATFSPSRVVEASLSVILSYPSDMAGFSPSYTFLAAV